MGVESGRLAISSDMSGEQFGKDVKWHDIWSYFSRNSDSCPSFGECINVEYSDVDVFWVTRGWVGHADRGYYCC